MIASGASTASLAIYEPNSPVRLSIDQTRTGGKTNVIYQNTTTAVKVAYSEELDRVETSITLGPRKDFNRDWVTVVAGTALSGYASLIAPEGVRSAVLGLVLSTTGTACTEALDVMPGAAGTGAVIADTPLRRAGGGK